MNWNGNSNGGYGQQNDVYDRMNNTKPIGGAKFPFVDKGRHKLLLLTLEEFMHSKDGPSARALFEVLESDFHQGGSYVVKIWKLVKPPKFDSQPSDADKFADFARKLKNAAPDFPIGQSIRVLMKERPAEQLARGTVIEANGVPNKTGTWTEIYWNAVQQSPEQITAMRQRAEAKGIPSTTDKPAQQPQQGYAPPHYAAQPPQQGYQMAQPQQPVQYAPPQAPQTQYAPAPAPVAPPQGGFLAQLPPPPGNGQGNGGQSGNGSW